MQCPSCRFHNLPGIEHCGRCGGNLRLAKSQIDVHPPRAADRRFLDRHLPSMRSFWRRVAPALADFRRGVFGVWDIPDTEPGPIIRRLIVPGWPQYYCGRPIRGLLFLGVFLLSLFTGLFFIGSGIGSILLGISLGCHLSSVLDIALAGEREQLNRLKRAVAWSAATILVLYVPTIYLFNQMISINVINLSMPPFMAGDVLWIRHTSDFSPGDVVLFEITPTTVAANGRHGIADMIAINGPRIDRILAGPGQYVVWDGSVLTVDGILCEHRPCNQYVTLPRMSLTVPASSVLIIPSTDPNIPANMLSQLSLTPVNQIRGRVVFRNLPFARLGFVN